MRKTVDLFGIVLIVSLLLPLSGYSQDRRYFPGTGPAAIHQRALDLKSSAVVMMVALQPGYEDLALLARLRMGSGARTLVVYWTNGEATPNDADGGSPRLLAAARREEAFKALSKIGAQAFFLNLPDPGVALRAGILGTIWNRDSLLARLVPMIRSYGPDALVIGGDLRGDTLLSARQRAVTELLLSAVASAAEEKDDSTHVGPWRVQRLLKQTDNVPGKRDPEFDQTHPVWKKTYRSLAREAASEYKTLRAQLAAWTRRDDRKYAVLAPHGTPAPAQINSGLPIISPRLKSLATTVRNAAGKETKGARTTSLLPVARAIDSLNIFLMRYGRTLTPADLHLISSWKNGLEDLRCSLLDVSITWQSSDSLVTEGQLFYLKFTGFSSQTSKTHTKILFPGVMQRRWGVNESAKYEHEFFAPQEFRVITPSPMDFNIPGAQFGITRPLARTRFSFLINHQDSLPGRDFTYRGEVLLQSGPRRTFELLTPAVRAIEREPVAYRLQNISRDGFEGSISLIDSTLNRTEKKVYMSQKDQVVVDTLPLSFKQPPPPGTSNVSLTLSGMGGSIPVVIRRFDAAVDSSARVLVLSDIEDSPLTEAMHRLRLPFRVVGDLSPETTTMVDVIVVDRDLLAGRNLSVPQFDALHAWVRNGGRLVVLPQGSAADRGLSLVPWASFEPGPLSAPDDSVVVSSPGGLLMRPNMITLPDWSNWVVSRSMWSIHAPDAKADEIVVRSGRTGAPLLLTRKEGKGEITLVALDLSSQLVNIHPGVHRLLANILKRSE
jgi:LmbE family N-acetylglucosaminyl deacetylase